MSTPYQEEWVEVAGANVQLLKGGRGDPLVLFHSIEGSPGWRRYHAQLAEHFTVYAPTLPGFGVSERPDWVESFFDLARFSLWLVQELGLDRATLGGQFIGGWLAAEMAVMSPGLIDKLILVDAAGIQPQRGEIADIFLHGLEGTRQLTYFAPEQVPEYEEMFGHKPSKEERDILAHNQETVVRYCWKPYMYDRSLPALLPRLRAPTLVIWGRDDRIVPLECGQRYQRAIPGARLEILPECGNCPPLEKPDAFSKLVCEFLRA